MANVAVYNMEGKEVGTIELSDAIFGAEVNEHLVHLAVVQYLADQRQGTQKAKTRAEVSGGGRKPWRQKGTGHARQGSTRSPQWTGGGVVFAPVPRDYNFKMNKKEKRAALRSALSDKVANSSLIVLEDLTLEEVKTKKFAEILKNLKVEKKALVVTEGNDDKVRLSARNLPQVRTAFITSDGANKSSSTINVYDIMNANTLILTKDAVAKIEEVYA
ncbi:MAG: 50S ribosomal protein L4 [Lachnospiraceae bacterium]|nr:50S ribosomal protein L4 [Lachnospiraceae bacterium]